MTFQQEIAKLATAVLADIKTAETAVETVTSNPAVSPFLPLIESTVESILTKYGVPVSDIEAVGKELFASINTLLTDAAALSGTTDVASATVTSGGTASTSAQ